MKPDFFFNDNASDNSLMSEINMTPFIDVMLVLLVIFLLAIPIVHHALTLTLPDARNSAHKTLLPHVQLYIHSDGRLLWNGKPIEHAMLATRFRALSKQAPQPELHVYADRAVRYECIMKIMATAQSNHLEKLIFVTKPDSD